MNKALTNIIIFSIFLVPMASIIPMHGTIIWYPQLLALMAVGFICLAMIFWNTNKFISLFFMYATFSYLFVCDQSPRAMLCLITGYCGIFIAYAVSKSIPSSIYKAIAVISLLNILFMILQIFNIDPIFTQTNPSFMDRTVGLLGSRNQVGIFHTGSSILLMGLSPLFLILSLPILVVKCSSAFAGLMVGITSYLFLIGKRLLAWLTILLIIVSIPVFIHFKGGLITEFKERLEVWELTIKQEISGKIDIYDSKEASVEVSNHRVVQFNPWVGIGIGNFFRYSPSSQVGFSFSPWHRYEHAHNDFIEALIEFGVIGIILILLCIASIVNDFMCCVRKTKGVIVTFCALISLSVCSLGVYVFQAPVSLFLFCLTLGLFYAEVANAKQSKIA